MPDFLKMDYINNLPQPFTVRLLGSKNWWPVYDIGVNVPFFRIDVCGLLQVCNFSDAAEFEDADGNRHDPDDWWIDA